MGSPATSVAPESSKKRKRKRKRPLILYAVEYGERWCGEVFWSHHEADCRASASFEPAKVLKITFEHVRSEVTKEYG